MLMLNKLFSGQPDKQLVINSYISNRWGTEERFPNPFEVGKPFQIRILVLENYFKIAVNGKHLCDYPHRVPVEDVKTIYIGGNIRVDFVEFQPPVSYSLTTFFLALSLLTSCYLGRLVTPSMSTRVFPRLTFVGGFSLKIKFCLGKLQIKFIIHRNVMHSL
ncbi:galactoside-binding lectin [Oesophagostomum dentatum]|uniref:Galectin n=1 Tax=Oesophagostomum dentatum TaxID=61180 RepID=A0A0B1SBK4_OESDE|nr:galactoside-binding lectin [Oesophagostomum dentatum]